MTFTFHTQFPRERSAAEQAVFGHALTDADYADLGGNILEDVEVQVWYNQPWSQPPGASRIRIYSVNKLAKTNVRMIPGRFDYSECKVPDSGKKTGALILRKIALAAKKHGFATLTGKGERAPKVGGPLTSWGFYASPRMGFDAPIPPGTPARPQDLAACIRLSDLMATQAGRDFWKAHGWRCRA